MFWYIALACATILAAFILPFHIPPTSEAYGQSYVIGFNNRIAILQLLAISLAVLWLQRRSVEVSATDGLVSGTRLGLPWLFSAWLVVSLWIVPTAKLILTHTSRSVEDFTFIPQLEKAFYFHRALYTQIEFAYGPLLFYPTLWLAHLLRFYNGPVNLAYYITLLVHHLVGLALLFYTLNRLPLRCSMRAVMFVLVGIYSLNPLMGLNYTLLRFMAPLASAILIAGLRDRRVAAAVSLVCTVAAFCLSAEVGVALAVGICGLALARMLRGDLRAVLLGVSAAVGTLLTFAFLPKEYFYSLHGFSLGYNNFAILPRPDVLLLLLCLVALAPIVAGRAVWRKHPSASAERVWILYIVALGMVPAALGDSESLHVMSSGIGLFLLGGVCVSGWPMPQIAYSALLLIAQTSMLYHHFQGARGRLMVAVRCGVPQAALVSAERLPPPVRGIARSALATTCPAYIDPADLNSSIHGEPFTVPWVTDANVSEHMVRMPNYRPGYFHGLINVWSREQQQRKVDEMRSVRWAVVLGGEQPQQQEPNGPTGFARATHFRARHNVFFDELMSNELRAHWVKVRQVSEGTWLYRRVQ